MKVACFLCELAIFILIMFPLTVALICLFGMATDVLLGVNVLHVHIRPFFQGLLGV